MTSALSHLARPTPLAIERVLRPGREAGPDVAEEQMASDNTMRPKKLQAICHFSLSLEEEDSAVSKVKVDEVLGFYTLWLDPARLRYE